MQWLKIAVRKSTLLRAIAALLSSSTARHEEARHTQDPKRALELRKEGDADAEAHNELWEADHGGAVVRNESVNGNSAPTQITKIELPERVEKTVVWIIPTLITFTVIVSACGVVMGIDIADRSNRDQAAHERLDAFSREEAKRTQELHDALQDLQRQYRMTELKLDDWTVVAHRAGLQLPGDYTRGPQGDLDAESFHINKRKEK